MSSILVSLLGFSKRTRGYPMQGFHFAGFWLYNWESFDPLKEFIDGFPSFLESIIE
jgi:hypothetical protein